jgi:hypothetical protein
MCAGKAGEAVLLPHAVPMIRLRAAGPVGILVRGGAGYLQDLATDLLNAACADGRVNRKGTRQIGLFFQSLLLGTPGEPEAWRRTDSRCFVVPDGTNLTSSRRRGWSGSASGDRSSDQEVAQAELGKLAMENEAPILQEEE